MLIKAGADVNAGTWRVTTLSIQAVAVEEARIWCEYCWNVLDPARTLPNHGSLRMGM